MQTQIQINKPTDLIDNIFEKTGYIEDPVIYKKFIYIVLDMLSRNRLMLPVIQEINLSTYNEEQVYTTLYYLPTIAPQFRGIFYPERK